MKGTIRRGIKFAIRHPIRTARAWWKGSWTRYRCVDCNEPHTMRGYGRKARRRAEEHARDVRKEMKRAQRRRGERAIRKGEAVSMGHPKAPAERKKR